MSIFENTLYEGHINQIDFQDDRIKALHLDGFDYRGRRVELVIQIHPPEAEEHEFELSHPRNGPLAYFKHDQRPKVEIIRVWDRA